MELFQDYEDLLKAFNAQSVKYLVVGAYAVAYYTEPRYTKDIDIWVGPSKTNAAKVHRALKEFGAPLINITPEDFSTRGTTYQIGVPPVRIDIMTELGGVSFAEAWRKRKTARYGGTPAHMIGLEELIIAKRVAGRERDVVDLAKLEKKRKKRTGKTCRLAALRAGPFGCKAREGKAKLAACRR
jgi:predicted nucleotidyltransferase